MSVEYIFAFLSLALLFYVLFAGADFGAGILEAFCGKTKIEEQKKLIARAMGPVWEANHVWLILAVVILFEGFPEVYSFVSIYFHIPLTILLVGIILRGCAFTFKSYDAVKDGSQKVYSAIFVISSFLASLMFGVVIGGITLARFEEYPSSFYSAYVAPWLNLFSFSVGVFTCIIFAFLASVYLVGETRDPSLKKVFVQRAKACNILAILGGLLVFFAASYCGLDLFFLFTHKMIPLIAMITATTLLFPLWVFISIGKPMASRLIVALQVSCILVGWFGLQFPSLIVLPSKNLTIYNSGSPPETMKVLLEALIIGCALILPSLYYLLRIFKLRENHS